MLSNNLALSSRALLGGAKAVSAFSPASFGANLIAWYKADAGVFSDAGVTPAANNATVQQWNDQSGNGNHLSQATAGARPTFKSAGLNGKQGVVFSAAGSNRMATAVNGVVVGAGNNTSWFGAARVNSATNSFARLITYVASGDTADFSGTHSVLALGVTSDDANMIAFQSGNQKTLSGITSNNDFRWGNIYDGAKFNGYFNSVLQQQPAAVWTIGSPGTIMVGADLSVSGGTISSSSAFLDGPVSELIVVNRTLTATEITNLEDYLRKRWGHDVPAAGQSSVLVVDTDVCADVGDVSGIQAAIALHKNNEVTLGLVLTNARNDYGPEFVRTILAANGLGSIPIGAYQGSSSNIATTSPFTDLVVTRFGNTANHRAGYTDAVVQARTVLAAAANSSVVWASIGYGPNLAGLLASAADGISPLTGLALFNAKVKRLVVMGGDYPTGTAEFNFAGDPADWNAIFAAARTQPLLGVGSTYPNGIISGAAQNGGALVSPSYYAFTLAGDNQGGGVFTRPDWDPLAIMFAVRGHSDGLQTILGWEGSNAVNGTTGNNTWTAGSDSGIDSYVMGRASNAAIQSAVTALIAPIL